MIFAARAAAEAEGSEPAAASKIPAEHLGVFALP